MKRLKKWFIGDYLAKTDNVFEKARIELAYDYCIFFLILALAFYGNLIVSGLWYHIYIVTGACIALATIPFLLKYKQNLALVGNWYVIQQTIVSTLSVIVQEAKPDMSGSLWTMSFIIFILFIFGTKRGLLRLIPFVSIFVVILMLNTMNVRVDFGIPESQKLPNQPFVTLFPFMLCVYLIIVYLRTNKAAEKQIQKQKEMVETKNAEITDSIRYAKRIQQAIMSSEKNIDQTITRLKKDK